MIKSVEIMSNGLQRVWETLTTPKEMVSFQNAYEKIISLYSKEFNGVEATLFLNKSYMKNYDFSEYQKPAEIISKQAKQKFIYLDRPNDPISCLVVGIAGM